jgi:nucleotide-binding universal stress UspA family protein
MQTPQLNRRVCLKNILFTTDFSSASEAALPYVVAFARWYNSKIIVAHIVPPEVRPVIPSGGPIPVTLDENWQEAERNMKRFEQSQPFTGVPHEFVVERGELTEVLASLVGRHEIDLLVLGSHGREGINKIVLGSKAERIFRAAVCPVLTVGPKVPRRPIDFTLLRRILFATDFSSTSLQALPYAISLAEENQACLMLLHLVPLPSLEKSPTDIRDSVTKSLQALVPSETTPWCNTQFLVRFEFPPNGILQVAEEHGTDLIVIGVRHASSPWAAAHTPWEIAYDVVCRAHCPVLTIRA